MVAPVCSCRRKPEPSPPQRRGGCFLDSGTWYMVALATSCRSQDDMDWLWNSLQQINNSRCTRYLLQDKAGGYAAFSIQFSSTTLGVFQLSKDELYFTRRIMLRAGEWSVNWHVDKCKATIGVNKQEWKEADFKDFFHNRNFSKRACTNLVADIF